jgi:hypothetical protein
MSAIITFMAAEPSHLAKRSKFQLSMLAMQCVFVSSTACTRRNKFGVRDAVFETLASLGPPACPKWQPAEAATPFSRTVSNEEHLHQNQPSNRTFNSYDEIVDACCNARNDVTKARTTATRSWASLSV